MNERILLERELNFIIGDKPSLEDKMNALDNALYMVYNPVYKNSIMIKVYNHKADSDVIYWEKCFSQRHNIEKLLKIYKNLK